MDVSSYTAGWRHRAVALRAREEGHAALARSRLPAAVSVLVEQFGASSVVLFGSLAEGTFTESSDIDLAASGLASRWFEAWDAAEKALGPGFKLDLIPVEGARPAIREAIECGEVMYARP